MSKKIFLLIGSFLLAFLLAPLSAQAFTIKADDSVYIPKDQVISGNFYTAGSNVTVDGVIHGDLFCAGQTVTINAKVEGDIICAAQAISIKGEVGGSVRVVGNTISLDANVNRNVNAFGASVILGNEARVGWDLMLATAMAEIRGAVNGSVHGNVKNLIISGKVGQNVDVKLDERSNQVEKGKITISSQAKIDGDVLYTSSQDGDISENNVSGKIVHNIPKKSESSMLAPMLLSRIYAIFSALIVGLVLVSLWRKRLVILTDKMLKEYGPALGRGAVLFFITPIAALILFITIIGIPLSLIILGLWLLVMFLSKIMVAVLVGRLIFKKLNKKETDKLLLEMTVGVVLCWLIFSIPVLGWLLSFVATLLGLGASWLYLRQINK